MGGLTARVKSNPEFNNVKGRARIALFAWFLGALFAAGSACIVFWQRFWTLGFFAASMAVFHSMEFFVTSLSHPGQCNSDVFLLNHSKEYTIAFCTGLMEYALEFWLFPGLKQHTLVAVAGVFLVCGGQSLRSLAMYTAASNFNHTIETQKRQEHVLVKHGVYKWSRHPSYCGWFWWCIGTQVVLCNPFCSLAFMFVSWKFFNDRIQFEEQMLVRFFGDEYKEYKKQTPVGIPFL